MCGYWWIWLPSHVWFSNVGPFSERIFRADFRFGVKISNIQLLGCLKAANLSFLEGWFFVCVFRNTEGFLTPDSFHSASLATWGSSCASKEAKFIKEFNFLGFSRCFSARIEQSSKTSKIQPNCVILGWFFEVCSMLSEKQRLKPRKSKSLINFASLDTQLDP